MERNGTILVVLPVIIIIVGLILNFPEFLMGNPATLKNIIVTVGYLVIWIFILSYASKVKNRTLMKFYSAFWLITLFFGILTVYVNSTEINAYWATPFVGLLLPQWYGIEYFVDNLLVTAVIISSVSFVMSIATILLLQRPYPQ